MKITWEIKKRRGNWRPVLQIVMTKDPWEVDLYIASTPLEVKIPHTSSRDKPYCLPGEYEREEEGKNREQHFFRLECPVQFPDPHQKGVSHMFILPWRPGAQPKYPEVEEAIQLLTFEWEYRVKAALESEELAITGENVHTQEHIRRVAPYVMWHRSSGGNTNVP